MDTRTSWDQLCESEGIFDQSVINGEYARLAGRYAEPHRAYHNLDHIEAMLELRDRMPFVIDRDAPLLWAIWFHDAVYDPRAADNEERSAEVFLSSELARMIPQESVARVGSTIMATKTHRPLTADESVLVDLDLSILGAPKCDFDVYETAIRQEYAHVPERSFARERIEILKSFLARPRIYSSDLLSDYEERARVNLSSSIRELSRTA